MRKIPDIESYNELNVYYESENITNTGFNDFEDINPRRPDAYIGLNNNVFSYPQPYFTNMDEFMDSEW